LFSVQTIPSHRNVGTVIVNILYLEIKMAIPKIKMLAMSITMQIISLIEFDINFGLLLTIKPL
jgi:hypothetical protein